MTGMDNGLLIILSGPSGAGKGTVCDALMKHRTDLVLSVSCTTRECRPGEFEGVDYYYKTKEDFDELIKQGEFLEYANVYSNYYGTPRSFVMEKLSQGRNVLLEIDVQGALNVKKTFPEGVYLFLVPPSFEELEHRIRSRATETEQQIRMRLSKAAGEMDKIGEYDYVIVNDRIDRVVHSIECIIEAERHKVSRNMEKYKHLRNGEYK
jgi:guanylate kinase